MAVGLPRRQPRHPRLLQVRQLLHRELDLGLGQSLGVTMHASTLQVILPVGISFYTFQTLSYSIDIYRGNLKATRDPVAFGAFVSFFPQLVAGPIERATNLLPQITSPRKFTYEQGRDGMRLILWGMFKKVVVADSCAPYVDMCFDNPEAFSGSTLILGAILFSFQIYGDFSGYSDIAIGTAKLFGFELMTNFKFPYFSRDIAEFWRRWHISLSTWFRDYLYIPLGGSRVSKPKAIRNVFIIFLVSGFWHGANWTFIAGAASTPCSSSRSSCAAPTGRTPRASSPKANGSLLLENSCRWDGRSPPSPSPGCFSGRTQWTPPLSICFLYHHLAPYLLSLHSC